MSEEDIRKELDKAAGNNLIEGHAITEAEKNLIYRIFEKYKGDYGSQAIDSLLYGLAVGVEDIKAEGGTRLMANVNSRFDEAMNKQSKYCYPNTDVLINKLGITDQEALDVAERRITTLMLMDLQTTPLPKPKTFFTPEYYFSLHKKIFEHIYSFAGETRNENITKGNTPFCRPEFLYSYMCQTFDALARKLVKIKDKEDVLDWLAYGYGELNIIHPFREGNGRVAREYLRQAVEIMDQHLGLDYELNLSSVNEEDCVEFMNASIFSAMTGDNSRLKEFFRTTLHEKSDVNIPKKER